MGLHREILDPKCPGKKGNGKGEIKRGQRGKENIFIFLVKERKNGNFISCTIIDKIKRKYLL